MHLSINKAWDCVASHPPENKINILLVGVVDFFFFLQLSFDLSEYTANVDGVGTLRLLDAIRTCGLTNKVKFYQVCICVHVRMYVIRK